MKQNQNPDAVNAGATTNTNIKVELPTETNHNAFFARCQELAEESAKKYDPDGFDHLEGMTQ